MLERSKSSLDTIDDEEAKNVLMNFKNEVDISLANLSSEIHRTEQVSKTLGIDAASELIDSLEKELEEYKNVASTLGLKPTEDISVEKAKTDMANEVKSLRQNADIIVVSALKQDDKKVGENALDMANRLKKFQENARTVAGSSIQKGDQLDLLQKTQSTLNSSKNLLNEAKRSARFPNNQNKSGNLTKSSKEVSKALANTLIATKGNDICLFKDLIGSIESELDDFKVSIEALTGTKSIEELGKEQEDIKKNIKSLQSTAHSLVNNILEEKIEKNEEDLLIFTSSLEDYLGSVKALALKVSDPKFSYRVINQAKEVVEASATLTSVAKKSVDSPKNLDTIKDIKSAEKALKVALEVTLSEMDKGEDGSIDRLMNIREKIQTNLNKLNTSTNNSQKMTNVKELAKSSAELIQSLKDIYANETDDSLKVR